MNTTHRPHKDPICGMTVSPELPRHFGFDGTMIATTFLGMFGDGFVSGVSATIRSCIDLLLATRVVFWVRTWNPNMWTLIGEEVHGRKFRHPGKHAYLPPLRIQQAGVDAYRCVPIFL